MKKLKPPNIIKKPANGDDAIEVIAEIHENGDQNQDIQGKVKRTAEKCTATETVQASQASSLTPNRERTPNVDGDHTGGVYTSQVPFKSKRYCHYYVYYGKCTYVEK